MEEPAPIQTYDVVGTPVSVVTPATALARLLAWAADSKGRYVCIRDVHGVMRARDDAELARIHREADMITPDGMPIAKIGKWRGLPVERTSGPDLMLEAMRVSPELGLKHYFHGGAEGVADLLKDKLTARFPGLQVVGTECPPFREITEEELQDVAKRVAESGAQFVWIGLSTTKQEKLMARLAPMVPATLVGVGAAFDIHSDRITRAPKWMRGLALEGVYRLLIEPRRLWYRYLVLAPKFVVLATIQHLRG
jgi:N-acetylglucosaminyldiphosphoundecaprenol N-acetyl-beta-D-mannosaminyltransferase